MNDPPQHSSEYLFFSDNPLLKGLLRVQNCLSRYKEKVRAFYFHVLLSQYECPSCGGDLVMTGPSQCSCSCGKVFDPTLVFQKSHCCAASLMRKTFHYACSRCHQTVPSRFLFDERLFDPAYFREMMRESRERTKRKKEEVRKLLAESRSGTLLLTEEPCLEAIPGLNEALNDFIRAEGQGHYAFSAKAGFRMEDYRDHILSVLGLGSRLFSDIAPMIDDSRRDRIWRFVTLTFMAQDRVVELTQYGADILVERAGNEAYG